MKDEIDFEPIDFELEDEIDFEPIDFEPEDTTNLEKDSSSMSYWGVPRSVLPPTSGEGTSALLRGAAQGATLGFGEELSAASGALFPTATDKELERDYIERYRAIRDQIRKENIEAEQQRPGAFLAGEILGGGLTSGAGGLATKAVARSAGLLGKLGAGEKLTKIGKYAIPAAIEGGLYGAGTSQADLTRGEVGELGKDVLTGGVIGGVAGLSVPALLKAGKKTADIAKTAGDYVGERTISKAFGAGLKGKALFSKAKAEQLLKGPTEKLAYELAKEVSDLGEKVAKPAMQKVEDTYRKTLEEAGKNLRLKGEEFSSFIKNKLDEHGKTIGRIFKEAEEAGTTVDISDILQTVKKNIDDLVLTDQVSKARAKELADLFNKNLFDEIKTERKITELFNVTPEGELTPTLRKVEEAGKEMTPEQLKRALALPATEIQPKITKEAILDMSGQRQLEKMTAEEVISKVPKGEVPVKIARAIKNTLGDVSSPRQQQLEGELRVVAGEAYSEIKKALDNIFTNQSDYMTANRGYSAVKDLLETAGEKRIEIDKLSGEVLTPERFAKIFEKIGNSLKEGDTYTYGRIMDKFKKIAPEAGEVFDLGIREASEKYQQIYAQRGLAPLEKGRALLQEGTPEVQKAVSELSDIEQLKTQIGELDPIKRQIDDITGEYVDLPEQKTRDFVSKLGKSYVDKKIGASKDIEAAINVLQKYNPELAKKVTAEGTELAEMIKLTREVTGKDSGGVSDVGRGVVGAILGPLYKFVLSGANVAGLGANKVGVNKLIKASAEAPELLGKFYDVIQSASRAGAIPTAVVTNILMKEDPEFKEIVDNVGQKYGYDNNQTDSDKLKNYLDFTSPETVPAEYNQFIAPLKNALERGDSAFKSKVYMMSDQYPKFREFLEKLKETE